MSWPACSWPRPCIAEGNRRSHGSTPRTHESVYAVAAGNLALDLQFGNVPGPRAELVAARDAYQDAADLGTTNPGAFRGLAIAKFHLGDRRGGIAAARRAVELNRFDPISVELLHSLQTR